MKRRTSYFILILAILVTFWVAACTPTNTSTVETGVQSGDEMQAAALDEEEGHEEEEAHGHVDVMTHMHAAAPEEFASLENPFHGEHKAIEAGEEIFQTNCATCHGPEGKGDGPAAESLDPQPASLADGTMMGDLSDGYLYWRVSKGGLMEPFNSTMPAWENSLTEEQRWQVISYVRTLAGDEAMRHAEDDHHEEEHGDEEDDQ